MPKILTKKQKDIYAYIAGYITDYGFAPTTQEIAIKFNMNTSAVEGHVAKLEEKGWIRFKKDQRFRKIELIPA